MNLKPLSEYLEVRGFGKRSERIFTYHMPENVREGIFLAQRMSGTTVDHELPGYYHSGFQLIVRHYERDKGDELTAEVVKALSIGGRGSTNQEQDIYGLRIKLMLPKHLPIVFPRSDGRLLEFSVNFETVFVEL